MKEINKKIKKNELKIMKTVKKENSKKYTRAIMNWFKSLWNINSKVVGQILEIKEKNR